MIYMIKTSKGEQKIIDLLNANHIFFKREYSFNNLKGFYNKPLRFDFAIFLQDKLAACLDFDGQQHFQFTPYFHKSKADFYKQLEYDRKKNKFCLLNNIPLLRIPYWDFDDLTFYSLFHNDSYRVKNKNHNLLLMRQG